MGVEKYNTRTGVFWKIDEELTLPDGTRNRFRKRRIPTRELAVAMLAKVRAEAFEGRFFDRPKAPTLTLAEAWKHYEPTSKRDNDSWRQDRDYARHLLQHLGDRKVAQLSLSDVEEYRNRRLGEQTKRGGPPSPATLDREVEFLKRCLNYAVRCGRLSTNPLASVKLLRKPNVRRMVMDEDTFARLLEVADPSYKPILLLAFDTGMRKREILHLQRSQLDLQEGVIRLTPSDNKEEGHRVIYLTERVLKALREQPRHLHSPYVFVSPRTGQPYQKSRGLFRRTCKAADLPCGGQDGYWFHDLRRSFVTRARRAGIPESVVMRMSGHRTRSVFERYNIVSEDDLKHAVCRLQQIGSCQKTVKVASNAGND